MTNSKDQKTTVTLESGQIAIVLGIEGQELIRRLVVSPEIDAMLDDAETEVPLNFLLASAFLMRLDRDENFGPDLADWYDDLLQAGAAETSASE